MGMKCKHKAMVEFTFDKKMTAKSAHHVIEEIITSADKETIIGRMDWGLGREPSVEIISVKCVLETGETT